MTGDRTVAQRRAQANKNIAMWNNQLRLIDSEEAADATARREQLAYMVAVIEANPAIGLVDAAEEAMAVWSAK